MAVVEVDIDVTCRTCGAQLTVYAFTNSVEIEPCQACIDDEFGRGYDEGYEDGKEGGY